MLITRTLLPIMLLFAAATSYASGEAPASNEKKAANTSTKKQKAFTYTLHIDNTVNKNNTVDSVLVILDKFDLSGAGFVAKVFYPDSSNQIVIEDLPAGRYYAEIYVLGLYKKHFSSVIRTVKSNKKNKSKLMLDYKDVYSPGNANIPGENIKLFAYTK